jgi:hypothetical protein
MKLVVTIDKEQSRSSRSRENLGLTPSNCLMFLV